MPYACHSIHGPMVLFLISNRQFMVQSQYTKNDADIKIASIVSMICSDSIVVFTVCISRFIPSHVVLFKTCIKPHQHFQTSYCVKQVLDKLYIDIDGTHTDTLAHIQRAFCHFAVVKKHYLSYCSSQLSTMLSNI